MDSERAANLISQLVDNVSELKEAMEPLLKGDLNTIATDLPVLDRASLYVHAAYAIETILFSNLKLMGTDTKNHAIMTEIARLRQYQQKLEIAEKGEQKPNMKLDKAAAGRMVKHDLAANNVKGKKRRFDDEGLAEQADSTPGMQSMIEEQQTEASETAASRSKPNKKDRKKQKQRQAGD